MKTLTAKLLTISVITLSLIACRGNGPIVEDDPTPTEPETGSSLKGFYLLNEGNMNMNKASLDFYDYRTGIYHRNIYERANPSSVLGLGDVGNDLAIYGSKLYAVINASGKVEVMQVATCKRIKVIDIKNCRYITFAEGKAYVSAYDGPVDLGAPSPNGFVAQIDTSTLEIINRVEVGRQPEQMAVVGNKLYVTNSGGYSPGDYERTISVIDLATFSVVKKIDVAINLQILDVDNYGDIYIASRGDYYSIPGALFVLDTKTDQVKKKFDMPCSNMTIVGDTAYMISTEYNLQTETWTKNYPMINIASEEVLSKSFISGEVQSMIEMPYGLAVDPMSRNIFITDARDYISPGRILGVDKDGRLRKYTAPDGSKQDFIITTGDIPGHFAFVR